ncbi:gamma-secretase subunit PEN-2-like isoform X2 [Oppia nitens]|nr:gamma-secretase subunit PEN-2-like isoform X2 [Oppia nitens]
MSDEDKVSLCRKYFYIGFACLPFLWLVNSVWFFKYAFGNGSSHEDVSSSTARKPLRRYVTYSMIGSAVWIVAIVAWITTFQLKRAQWEATGDYLSFNIPRGIP